MKRLSIVLSVIALIVMSAAAHAHIVKAPHGDGWVISDHSPNPMAANPYLEVSWSAEFNEYQKCRLVGDIRGLEFEKEFQARQSKFDAIRDAMVAANASSGVVRVYLDGTHSVELYGKDRKAAELVEHYLSR